MLYNIEPFFPLLDLPELPEPPDLLDEELEEFELLDDVVAFPALFFDSPLCKIYLGM
jgi:hypothetical protein